ncbi:hypothetical protein PVAP13_8NG139302 [Panicum virgatum]|uniref:LCR-like protein n=1 Tax=Panicum virgatum TaxID=38727 RepID=A0A8T0PG37_PANVG|nr:hypothetical protein PVAP13_8NG139302 [Panicum virgatum]
MYLAAAVSLVIAIMSTTFPSSLASNSCVGSTGPCSQPSPVPPPLFRCFSSKDCKPTGCQDVCQEQHYPREGAHCRSVDSCCCKNF